MHMTVLETQLLLESSLICWQLSLERRARSMADEVGSASVAATEKAPDIGIGILGYAFMGKAHTNAYKKLPYMIYPPPAVPNLVAVAGRDEAAVQEVARRYGYESYYINWQDMLANPQVQLFDNSGPNNLHAEPCIAAAQ